jgi:hypothetical protein
MCTLVDKIVQLKSKIQHIGTWSAAALPLRRLCYLPALFFRLLRLIALSFQQGKNSQRFKKIVFFFFTFLKLLTLEFAYLEISQFVEYLCRFLYVTSGNDPIFTDFFGILCQNMR